MNTQTRKIALVTGGSRGIGRAIVKTLAQQGFDVAFTYQKEKTRAQELVEELSSIAAVTAVRADMNRDEDIQELFETVKQKFGRLDVLVNNAGAFDARPFGEFSSADVRASFQVNVFAVFQALQSAAQLMDRGGKLINISSDAVNVNVPNTAVYAATKAAVDQFTRVLAQELGPRGITVNSVLPGFTATDWAGHVPESVLTGMASKAALGRIGEPEDVAKVVGFLASDAAAWITGQKISVTGGL